MSCSILDITLAASHSHVANGNSNTKGKHSAGLWMGGRVSISIENDLSSVTVYTVE